MVKTTAVKSTAESASTESSAAAESATSETAATAATASRSWHNTLSFTFLFCTQRYNRVFLCRAAGRDHAGKHRQENTDDYQHRRGLPGQIGA